ncbi:MAG: selenide, water dikinase SelD, partial [Thermodesulfobacteriota bacterium]
CGMAIFASQVPVIPQALEYAQMGLVPGGTHANRNYCRHSVTADVGIPAYIMDILSDAQTSGGLLISVPSVRAQLLLEKLIEKVLKNSSLIGEVI